MDGFLTILTKTTYIKKKHSRVHDTSKRQRLIIFLLLLDSYCCDGELFEYFFSSDRYQKKINHICGYNFFGHDSPRLKHTPIDWTTRWVYYIKMPFSGSHGLESYPILFNCIFLYLKQVSLHFFVMGFVYEVCKSEKILFTFIQKNCITMLHQLSM